MRAMASFGAFCCTDISPQGGYYSTPGQVALRSKTLHTWGCRLCTFSVRGSSEALGRGQRVTCALEVLLQTLSLACRRTETAAAVCCTRVPAKRTNQHVAVLEKKAPDIRENHTHHGTPLAQARDPIGFNTHSRNVYLGDSVFQPTCNNFVAPGFCHCCCPRIAVKGCDTLTRIETLKSS